MIFGGEGRKMAEAHRIEPAQDARRSHTGFEELKCNIGRGYKPFY